ncbi:MAG: DUF1648 domain-containing protein [Bacteroidetes bacterium]|nr:DUF1648 domain-containing protein [Bacteroidota bacterium]
MNTIHLKKESVLWLLTLLPIVYIIYIWPQLPAEIPVHYNLHGEVDGWGGRSTIFLMPGIMVVSYFLLLLLPKIDPKRMAGEFFASNFYKIRVVVTAAMSAISILLAHLSLSHTPDTHEVKYIPILVLLLLAVLGNFIINIKPNWFIGIRTPWTLSSDHVWKQTHLVFGRIWFYGGLLSIVAVLILPDTVIPYIIAGFALGTTALSFVYSWWLHHKETGKAGEN